MSSMHINVNHYIVQISIRIEIRKEWNLITNFINMVALKLSTDKTELVRFFLYLSYWKRIEYFESPAGSNFFIILHLPTLNPVFYVFTTSTCWTSFRFFWGFFVVFFDWFCFICFFVFQITKDEVDMHFDLMSHNGLKQKKSEARISIQRPVYTAADLQEVYQIQDDLHSFTKTWIYKTKAYCSFFNLWLRFLSFFPVLTWLPKYQFKKWFVKDLSAGLTLGIMQIPQGQYMKWMFENQLLTDFLGNNWYRNLQKKPEKKLLLLSSIFVFMKLCMLAKYNQKYRSFEKGKSSKKKPGISFWRTLSTYCRACKPSLSKFWASKFWLSPVKFWFNPLMHNVPKWSDTL